MKQVKLWLKDLFKSRDNNLRKETSKIKAWKRIIILTGLLASIILAGVIAMISKGWVAVILITACLIIIVVAGIVFTVTMFTNFKFYKEAFRCPYHLRKITQNKKFIYKLLIIPLYLLGLSILVFSALRIINLLWQLILTNLFNIDFSSTATVFSFQNIMDQPLLLYTMIAFMALIGPFLEEISFRLFYLYILDSFWGRTASVILIISIFSLMHVYSFAYVLAIIPLACILTFLIIRTGSLLPCILVHVLNNLITTIVLIYK